MPAKKISQLDAGTANLTDVVPASNSAGTATSKLTLQSVLDLDTRWNVFKPGAPTGVTATGGNGQVALTWTAPTGVISQAPITDYSVQYSSNGGTAWQSFFEGVSTNTSANVTGLTNGTPYIFRVAATNAIGTGPWSANSQPATPASSKFVMVADGGTKAAVSGDGTAWTLATLPTSEDWLGIAYGNGVFVAIPAYPDHVAVSSNGTVWTNYPLPGYVPFYGNAVGISFTNGRFYANSQYYSTDGINWSSTTLGAQALNGKSVVYGTGANRYVSVGHTSNGRASHSADGVNWDATWITGMAEWNSVAYGSGKFAAVANYNGGAGSSAYATSGYDWVGGDLPNGNWQKVIFANDIFVAIARGGTMAATSTNGMNWTQRTLPVSANWTALAYGAGQFVAVASGSAYYATSPDGITWTQQTHGTGMTANWNALAYG